eukprot:SAG31_NODE_37182_length_306_cov_1.120773_2_plen_37_part_01
MYIATFFISIHDSLPRAVRRNRYDHASLFTAKAKEVR